jgi:hypothetical protein
MNILVSVTGQVGGFPRVLRFPPSIKLTHHDIAVILLIMASNTITPYKGLVFVRFFFNPTLLGVHVLFI